MTAAKIRPAAAEDWDWIDAASVPIGGPVIAAAGRLVALRTGSGLAAADADGARAGVAVWTRSGRAAELLAIAVETRRRGVGSLLLDHVVAAARDAGCATLRAETTDDNAAAHAFYAAAGFALTARIDEGFDEVRRLKNIAGPILGAGGVPIRDILVFEKRLQV